MYSGYGCAGACVQVLEDHQFLDSVRLKQETVCTRWDCTDTQLCDVCTIPLCVYNYVTVMCLHD